VTRFEFTTPNPAMRTLLSTLLVRGRETRVDLDDADLDVRMGWLFQVRLPRTSITSAREDHRRVYGWGVHTSFRGRWLVNTASQGQVRLTIDPPARGRCTGVPVTVRELRLSLQEPQAFLAALRPQG
jgi:hypothetical protein